VSYIIEAAVTVYD